MTAAIHAIILTLNEERHIRRCIESILPVCDSILVVDSGSNDQTCAIAKSLGATVVSNPWKNYATQLNHGIDLLRDKTGWLLRIDADEIFGSGPVVQPRDLITKLDPAVTGLAVMRRIYFMGRRIRFGGIEPSWQLRLWRNGAGRCEQRWMDEHVRVSGVVQKSDIVLSDINLNSLNWWTSKHNGYAVREAIDVLNKTHKFLPQDDSSAGSASFQAEVRRFLKEKLYLKLPAGFRSVAYFFYRYVVRLGFLDGRAGYYFHLLQGLWYRSLVDATVAEIEMHAKTTGKLIVDAIFDLTGKKPV
jgi:glycosyltransferase involved in cell wall biosynthesis